MGPGAMAVMPLVLAGVSAAGTVGGIYMQYEAGRRAQSQYEDAQALSRQVAERNARRIEEEGKEEVRRQAEENRRLASLAEAKVGATGAKPTGTMSRYVQGLRDIGERELQWIKKATASQADIARLGGELGSIAYGAKAREAGYRSTSALVSGVGGLTDWWKEYGGEIMARA